MALHDIERRKFWLKTHVGPVPTNHHRGINNTFLPLNTIPRYLVGTRHDFIFSVIGPSDLYIEMNERVFCSEANICS